MSDMPKATLTEAVPSHLSDMIAGTTHVHSRFHFQLCPLGSTLSTLLCSWQGYNVILSIMVNAHRGSYLYLV